MKCKLNTTKGHSTNLKVFIITFLFPIAMCYTSLTLCINECYYLRGTEQHLTIIRSIETSKLVDTKSDDILTFAPLPLPLPHSLVLIQPFLLVLMPLTGGGWSSMTSTLKST